MASNNSGSGSFNTVVQPIKSAMNYLLNKPDDPKAGNTSGNTSAGGVFKYIQNWTSKTKSPWSTGAHGGYNNHGMSTASEPARAPTSSGGGPNYVVNLPNYDASIQGGAAPGWAPPSPRR